MMSVIKGKLKEVANKVVKYIEVSHYERVLTLAARHGTLENIELSLSKGVDVNVTEKALLDSQGYTALHFAAIKGHVDAVAFLLKRGADINAADMMDWTPLHFAAFHNHAGVVAVLLENGADITARENNRGRTPLGMAIDHNFKNIVEIFLQYNVGLMERDNDWVASILPCLDSQQLNAMNPNAIEILCPHPSQADYWITTVAELKALSPADKLAIAYRWPHGVSRSDLISEDIKTFTKNALKGPFEIRLTRLATEYCAIFRKLEQLFKEKPTLRQETLGALSEKEKTGYDGMFFVFDNYKETPGHIQRKICTKITGANQEPTEDEVNAATGRLKAI